jgi:hypothetical protein
MAASVPDVEALCASLSSANLGDEAASVCQQVAELAKNEHVRTPLGEGGALARCCDLLQRASETGERKTLVQAARAIGNLCFDHPENRKRVLASGAIGALAKVMLVPEGVEGDEAATQALAGAGVVINTSQDDEEIVKALVEAGAVENLLWLVQHAPSDRHLQFALVALNRFQGSKEAAARLARAGGAKILLGKIRELEEEQVDEIFHLLREAIDDDASLPHLAGDGTLELLLDLRQDPGSSEKIAASSGLLLSAALSDDACLDRLLAARGTEALLSLFVSWLQHATDEDLHVTGAIAIGNVARSDVRCDMLLKEARLIPALATLLAHDRTRTQHATLGALKNLSNYVPAKPLVAEALPLGAVLQALHAGAAHIQYQAATLLRSLLLKQPAFVQAVTAFPGIVPRLVHLHGSEEERVRAESVRALGNMLRSGTLETQQVLVDAGALGPLCEMLSSQHPLLRVEAASALAHACSESTGSARAAVRAANINEKLTVGLTDASNPPELLGTLVALLALTADASLVSTEHGPAVIAAVKSLSSHPHPAVATQASRVVEAMGW